eukprot:11277731-Alexandrium_andersonii.AAC.1
MSASLVGSEMCIRDSEQAFKKLHTVWRRKGLSKGVKIRTYNACVNARLPVSYTHLTLPTICSV